MFICIYVYSLRTFRCTPSSVLSSNCRTRYHAYLLLLLLFWQRCASFSYWKSSSPLLPRLWFLNSSSKTLRCQRCWIWEQSFFCFSVKGKHALFLCNIFVSETRGFPAIAAKTENRLHTESRGRKPDRNAWAFRHDWRMKWTSLSFVFTFVSLLYTVQIWEGKNNHISPLCLCRIQWRHWSLTCSNGHTGSLFHWVELTLTSG